MIHAIVIAGADDVDRYLSPVLERAGWWADNIHLAMEPDLAELPGFIASPDYSTSTLNVSLSENEGMAKDQAWREAVAVFQPAEDDLLTVLKPTEIVLEADSVRGAAKQHPGLALSVRLSHVWEEGFIRTDGGWAPTVETMFVPFRRGGHYPDLRLRAGRLPTYHFAVALHDVPVSDMLDYDMMTFSDKVKKHQWFERVGGEDFWSPDHIRSIQRRPHLELWKRGGLLNVGETDG